MAPTLVPGVMAVGWRWLPPRVGSVVVARHEGRPLIKRVVKLEAELVWLEGDNRTASTDSRQFGPVGRDAIEAIILWPTRRGL